jgi:hypothetical protein
MDSSRTLCIDSNSGNKDSGCRAPAIGCFDSMDGTSHTTSVRMVPINPTAESGVEIPLAASTFSSVRSQDIKKVVIRIEAKSRNDLKFHLQSGEQNLI